MINFIDSWDLSTVLHLNKMVGMSFFGDVLILFFAVYLVYPFAVAAILYWFSPQHKMRARKAVVVAFFSFITSRFIIAEAIRLLWHRPRPFLESRTTLLINKGNEASFPSGHATSMFAIAMSIYFYNKKLGGWLFVMAILTGIFRVVIAVHYPSDIVGGIILGIAVAWAFEQFANRPWFDRLVQKVSDISDKLLPFTVRK